MFWKEAPLSRVSLMLASGAVGLILVSALSFLAAAMSGGLALGLVIFAEGAFVLALLSALAGVVVGIAAQRRERGARPALILVLSLLLFAGTCGVIVSVLMSADGV